MYSKNVFKYKYLHPKYALTWLGVGVLYLLVQLPYTWIVMIGGSLGNLSRLILKRRAKIVKRNLQLCFPDKSVSEIEQMVKRISILSELRYLKQGWHGSGVIAG